MRGAGNQIQYALGDDCPSSGPRCSGRQSLSTILLIGGMRLSLFCNARRKSRRCQTSPRCCETKDGISSHSGTARQQCCRVHARAYAPGCRSIFQGHAMRGTPCLRRTEQQTSAAAEGACAESPLGGTVATQASACSGAVENFKSPKHHDDSRYQRGRHQHTFQGSDSHPLYSPLPSPASGLVDSRAAAIIRSQCYQSCVKVVVCGAQWGTWCSSKGKGPCEGPFRSVVPEQGDQQNDRQRHAQ